MASDIKNLEKCFDVLKYEYQLEEERKESITNKSGVFLQLCGVIAGISIVQIVAFTSDTDEMYFLLAYCAALTLSLFSIICLTLAMRARDYKRFPHKSIVLKDIESKTEIGFLRDLIQSITEIVSFNQAQNGKRLNRYSLGIWLCSGGAFLLTLALISNAVLRG